MSEQHFVEIVESATGKVKKRMGPMSESKAEKVELGMIRRINENFFVRSGTDKALKKEAAERASFIVDEETGQPTLADLQRAGIMSSDPVEALRAPSGSSPALKVPCPVCYVDVGAYCLKGHGKIQIISHKKRRELAAAKGFV